MPRSRIRYIFTYGTLMSTCTGQQGRRERNLLARTAQNLGTAAIRGRLFEAGLCPAGIRDAGPSDRIQGEVWELSSEHQAVLAALDDYEGCGPLSPRPAPYRRTRIRPRLADGRRVTAWMYVWSLPTDTLTPVSDGRWQEAHAISTRAAACAIEPSGQIRRGRAPIARRPAARAARRSP